jgi:hypothetical protein
MEHGQQKKRGQQRALSEHSKEAVRVWKILPSSTVVEYKR